MPCPMEPQDEHSSHKPWQCPILRTRANPQQWISKRVCPACLAKPLDTHSAKCAPVFQTSVGGKRTEKPLFCQKCPKITVQLLSITCLQNRRICPCAQAKLKKEGKNSSRQNWISPSSSKKSKSPRQSSSRKKSSKGTKRINNIFTSQSPVESDASASHTENYASAEETDQFDETETTDQVEVNWVRVKEDGESDSSSSSYAQLEEFENTPDEVVFWTIIDEVSDSEINPNEPEPIILEPATSNFNVNHVTLNKTEIEKPPISHDKTIPIFSLGKLRGRLPYVNEPKQKSFLLSESLHLVNCEGQLKKHRFIYDSGAQKACSNLQTIHEDCYSSIPANFSVTTVSGCQKLTRGCKAELVLSNSPHDNDLPKFYKVNTLGLRFDQTFNSPCIKLDKKSQQLLDTTQTQLGKNRNHHLAGILGADCLSIWPTEVIRNGTFCIYRSSINPATLLAFGSFPQDVKTIVSKKLEVHKVHLVSFKENMPYVGTHSKEFKLSSPLNDQQVAEIFNQQDMVDDNPFLTAILQHCPLSNQPTPIASNHEPSPASPKSSVKSCSTCPSSLPGLATSESDDSEVSLGTEVFGSDSGQSSIGSRLYEVFPRQDSLSSQDLESLTSSSDSEASLPSCSTEYSNCLNDEQKLKFSKQLARFRLTRQLTSSDNDEKVQSWLDHSDPSESDSDLPASSTAPCFICHTSLAPVPSNGKRSNIIHHLKLCRSAMQPMIEKMFKLTSLLSAGTGIPSNQQTNMFQFHLSKLESELEAFKTQLEEEPIGPST